MRLKESKLLFYQAVLSTICVRFILITSVPVTGWNVNLVIRKLFFSGFNKSFNNFNKCLPFLVSQAFYETEQSEHALIAPTVQDMWVCAGMALFVPNDCTWHTWFEVTLPGLTWKKNRLLIFIFHIINKSHEKTNNDLCHRALLFNVY